MKDLIKTLSLGFLFLGSQTALSAELIISNLRSNQGHVAVSIYSENDKEHFPGNSDKAIKTFYLAAPVSGDLQVTLEDIAPGNYAVAVMHDEDSNKKLKTTFGIPREGFGFSMNPSVYFGPPDFEKAVVKVEASSKIEIKMKHFL